MDNLEFNLFLLEAEAEENFEDIDMEAEENAIENDMTEPSEEENQENTNDNTKQNNNEEKSDGETEEVENPDNEVEQPEEPSEGDTNDNIEDGETQESEPEEEDDMSKSKRLLFFNEFETLFNTTLNFIDKLDYIKDNMSNEDKNLSTVLELENRLLKQKNDINFLLKKKIMNTSEENLDKLLLYFSTKTTTIIDITKSLIKEAN